MSTAQHPQQAPRPRLRIVLGGDVSAALVVIGELDVEIVRDELPHSLRSLASEPLPCSVCGKPGLHEHDDADDYVDQGDEPDDDDDHLDPWAHPKHDNRLCPVCGQPDPGITHEHDDTDPEPVTRCRECGIRLPAALHIPGCSRPDRTLSLG